MIDTSDLATSDSTTDSTAGLFRRYLLSLSAGLLSALGLFCLSLFWLEKTQNLPPPAFSNNLCVDEKLSFLRSNPVASPNLLVIGSSVAWRHIDGDTLVREMPMTKPLNGAFCGLFANQAVHVANWLLDREPSIRNVVMVADPQDFMGCWRVPDAVFSRADADAYMAERSTPWVYYMRYFSPRSLIRNALTVKDQRAGRSEWDPLVFNRYGDGPLITDNSRSLLYGKPEALDRNCFNALQALSHRLNTEGRRFMMVSTPLHPEWKAKYDPQGTFLADFDKRILASLGGTGAIYWNADKEWQAPVSAFVDAVHLRWSAAQQFSDALASRLRAQEAAPLPSSRAETASAQ